MNEPTWPVCASACDTAAPVPLMPTTRIHGADSASFTPGSARLAPEAAIPVAAAASPPGVPMLTPRATPRPDPCPLPILSGCVAVLAAAGKAGEMRPGDMHRPAGSGRAVITARTSVQQHHVAAEQAGLWVTGRRCWRKAVRARWRSPTSSARILPALARSSRRAATIRRTRRRPGARGPAHRAPEQVAAGQQRRYASTAPVLTFPARCRPPFLAQPSEPGAASRTQAARGRCSGFPAAEKMPEADIDPDTGSERFSLNDVEHIWHVFDSVCDAAWAGGARRAMARGLLTWVVLTLAPDSDGSVQERARGRCRAGPRAVSPPGRKAQAGGRAGADGGSGLESRRCVLRRCRFDPAAPSPARARPSPD